VVGTEVFFGVDVGWGEGFGVLEIIVVGEGVGEGVGFLFAESFDNEEYHKSTGTTAAITATSIKTSATVLVIPNLDDKSFRLVPNNHFFNFNI
jgi:hypothetical protein